MTFKKKEVLESDGAEGILPVEVSAPVVTAGPVVTMPNESLMSERMSQPTKCDHINRHFINADGVREDLLCTLQAGHEGDHSAPYTCLRLADGSIAQARAVAAGKPTLKLSGRVVQGVGFVQNQYVEVTETAFWSDGASVPADQIKPDTEQLAYIKRTKGDMLDAAQLERRPVL